MQTTGSALEAQYRARMSVSWRNRIRRMLEPPAPFLANPHEPRDFPLGRWNLYVGGAGRIVPHFVNLDLFAVPGVNVAADAGQLPFPDSTFQLVECDAVLEHVRDPAQVMREMERVLAAGGYIHLVTPFCHPFHEYPKDYRRFTLDGLKELAAGLEVVASGWRTGPTATLLVFILEYVKLIFPFRVWRVIAHGVVGWLIFPFRYLDLWLLRAPHSGRIGNHAYVWLRKPAMVSQQQQQARPLD